MVIKIVTIAQYSVALEGERSKDELEQLAERIKRTCLSEKDIVYAPSVWLEDYDIKEMDIISADKG